jgi:hypothetical protein
MCQIKFHLTLFIFGTLFFLISKEALAYDCSWGGPFLENTEQADLIIRGKILAYHEGNMSLSLLLSPLLEVEVLEVYKGTFSDSKLRVISNFTSSISYLNFFPVGTEWVLALKRWPNGNYTIPGCFGSWLKVEPSIVGNLNNSQRPITPEAENQRVSLEEFRSLLKEEEPSILLNILLNNYDKGVQAGRQQCIDDPASCGIHTAWPEASYEPENGKLYIPAVKAPDTSGNITIYEVILNQRAPSFVFDLDLNSVKAHQQ